MHLLQSMKGSFRLMSLCRWFFLALFEFVQSLLLGLRHGDVVLPLNCDPSIKLSGMVAI